MSGHSKWATIHRQKETTDARRGLLFSKLARAITLAAKQGGPNPQANMRLRIAVETARAADMPKENIAKAIGRAGGTEGGALEEVKYEGYGPEGVAVMVEAATDNKNRTAQEIKNLFERGGGSLSGPGSVAFNFSQTGLVLLEKEADAQTQMLKLIDLGVEDLEESEDGLEVYVKPGEVSVTQGKLTQAGFKVIRAELVARPQNLVTLAEPQRARRALAFLDQLHAHEDVQKVFANLDIPNEVLVNL